MIQIIEAICSLLAGAGLIYIWRKSRSLSTSPWHLRLGIAFMALWLFWAGVHLVDYMQEPVTKHMFTDMLGKVGILAVISWIIRFHNLRGLWDKTHFGAG